MKILKILFIAVLVIIAAVLIASVFAPKSYWVSRSIVINAPVESAFDEVVYFKNFPEWSPWQQLDTAQKQEISGTDGQLGAMLTWRSDKREVGSGHLERKVVEANKHIEDELVFADFGMASKSAWDFEPNTEGTKVTWTTSGGLILSAVYSCYSIMRIQRWGPILKEA